jgi:hypothetical protein
VIVRVRDTAVSTPEDVLKSVESERQQKRSFVPVQVSDSTGMQCHPPFRHRYSMPRSEPHRGVAR